MLAVQGKIQGKSMSGIRTADIVTTNLPFKRL